MRRRSLLVSSLAAASAGAHAQRLPLIGALHWDSAAAVQRIEELRRGLAAVGLVEGRNVKIEWRWAAGDRAKAREAARELVRLGVDVIFAHTTPTVHEAKEAAPSTPIVFWVSDPLATGIVGNLSRPGGNHTGVGSTGPDLAPKRLEFLRELLPGLARIAFLGSTLDPNAETFIHATSTAGRQLGIDVRAQRVRGAEEFDDAFARMKAEGAQAAIIQPLFREHRARLAALQLGHRMPAVSDWPPFARDGLLLSFGPDLARMMTRAASQIDRILKGTKPGELPVELPTHFEVVLNRRTAAALGIDIPPALLARADEVIE